MRQTNWYVITGGPCAGKTTVIEALERRGFRVIHEVARAHIRQLSSLGLSLEQIKTDELSFERAILYNKLTIEAGLPDSELIFFDRAVPDSIAYFKYWDLGVREAERSSHRVRYKKVFLLDQVTFVPDIERAEDSTGAARLEMLLDACYRQLGYSPVRIPVCPPDRRVDMILKQVEQV